MQQYAPVPHVREHCPGCGDPRFLTAFSNEGRKVIDKTKPAPHRKREAAKERSKKRGNNNNDPSTLIITEHDNHSAKDICESHTAVGPDLVSMNEKLYCDMSVGQVWPLCDTSLKTGWAEPQKWPALWMRKVASEAYCSWTILMMLLGLAVLPFYFSLWILYSPFVL